METGGRLQGAAQEGGEEEEGLLVSLFICVVLILFLAIPHWGLPVNG